MWPMWAGASASATGTRTRTSCGNGARCWWRTCPIPKVFSVAMGDYAYFLRHPDLDALQAAIAYIEEQA